MLGIPYASDDTRKFPGKRPRPKNLEAQRAFRARKAAHVTELEREVTLLRSEVFHLRAENANLRAVYAATAPASAVRRNDITDTDTATSAAGQDMQAATQRCCAADILCELAQQQVVGRPSVFSQPPSQSCTHGLPPDRFEPQAASVTPDRVVIVSAQSYIQCNPSIETGIL